MEIKDRTIEGSYLTCSVTAYGSLVWFRISYNVSATLNQDTEYKPFKISNLPKRSVYRRISLGTSLGFVFKIATDGTVSITPFGGDIASGSGINVSEFFIQT